MEDKIQAEVKELQKKLEKIEKNKETLKKIQQLDREHQQKLAQRPAGHLPGEMM